jgi:uridine phosphorylase
MVKAIHRAGLEIESMMLEPLAACDTSRNLCVLCVTENLVTQRTQSKDAKYRQENQRA